MRQLKNLVTLLRTKLLKITQETPSKQNMAVEQNIQRSRQMSTIVECMVRHEQIIADNRGIHTVLTYTLKNQLTQIYRVVSFDTTVSYLTQTGTH